MIERVCKTCGQSRPDDFFRPGHHPNSDCRVCRAARVRRHYHDPTKYHEDREHKKERMRKYNQRPEVRERKNMLRQGKRGQEYVHAREYQWQKNHRGITRLEWECILAQKKSETIAQRKAKQETRRLRREQRAKEIAEKVARGEMYPGGKPKGRIRTIEFMKRYRNDPAFYVLVACRRRISNLIKRGGLQTPFRTAELIGCTKEKLMQHIELQFKPGMSWENKGQWHIDHIKDCALFDLTDPIQQRECFHYTNLRPLWAHENQARPKHKRKA